jgi:hypothetical protein
MPLDERGQYLRVVDDEGGGYAEGFDELADELVEHAHVDAGLVRVATVRRIGLMQ